MDMKTTGLPRKCQLCGKGNEEGELIPAELVREPVVELIRKSVPDWKRKGYICRSDLNRFRIQYVEDLMEEEKGELNSIEKDVLASLEQENILARDINSSFDSKLTLGQRTADKIASFGGSWKFIIIFGIFLIFWMAINTIFLIRKPFDPYPFILLNLLLSSLAAIQAPVIMMSQNRQESKDRLRAENDYRVNLKAELEIRHLHEKIDHMLSRQWGRLVEIQEIQIDFMNEIARLSGIRSDNDNASKVNEKEK